MLPTVTITQSEEFPQVFLISETTPFSQYISSFLRAKSLDVVQTNPENITEQYLNDSIYKAIWLVDIATINIHTVKTVQQQLKALRAPLIILVPIITAVEASDGYEQWLSYIQKQTLVIEELSTVFSSAHFIFIENLLHDKAISPLFSCLQQSTRKNIVLDPQIDFRFIDEKAALKSIEEPLFRPGFHQSLLIKGTRISSETITIWMHQQFEHMSKVKFEKKVKPVKEIKAISFTVLEKTNECDVEEYIHEQIRALAVPIHSVEPEEKIEVSLPKPQLNTTVLSPPTQKEQTVLKVKQVESQTQKVTTQDVETAELIPFEESIKKTEIKPPITFDSEQEVQTELQRIFTTTRTQTKVKRVVKIAEVEDRIVKKSKHKKVLFWGGLGVTGAGLSLLSLFLAFSLSFLIVKQQLISVIQASTALSEEPPNWKLLQQATEVLDFQTGYYSTLVDNAAFSQASQVVEISKNVQIVKENNDQKKQLGEDLFQVIFQQKPTQNIDEIITKLQEISQENHEKIALIQENIHHADLGLSDAQRETSLVSYDKLIQESLRNSSSLQQLLPLLPQILGSSSEKTYAVVFQNNQELRPTGGFVQSIGVITVNKGTIVAKEFFSSYDLDEKTSGFVAPPEEITRYLGEDRLFLRDSNWDPDFPQSAEKMTWFIENSTNKKIDGIITLDVQALEKLLQAVGPVELPQYNEVITDKNVDERLEFHSEVTFINKEDNPDYSTVLFSALISSLEKLPADKVSSFYTQVQSMLKENNSLIALKDSNENMSIKNLGWSGSLISPDCPSALHSGECYVDTVAQVEANVGVNKANYYIDRSINHTVTLGEQEITHKRTITYKNNAQTNTWPKGSYKSFIRLYLPKNTTLKNVFFNTTEISQEAISNIEVNDRRVFGFLIDVPINSQSIVELEYTQPVSNTLPYSYAFFEQKQPGSPETPFTLTVVPPSGAQPTLIAPAAQIFSNTIVFQETQKNHLFYGIAF